MRASFNLALFLLSMSCPHGPPKLLEQIMKQEVWTTIIPRPTGTAIVVVKLSNGGASSRWMAQQMINTARTRQLPVEDDDAGLMTVRYELQRANNA